MKIKEFNQKNKKELEKILEENQEKLRDIRFKLSSSKIKNIREIRKIKRDNARIFTLLNQKSKIKN